MLNASHNLKSASNGSVAWLGSVTGGQNSLLTQSQIGLATLKAADLPIPTGFLISGDFLRRFFHAAKLDAPITRALLSIDWNQPKSLTAAEKTIKQAIRTAPWPKALTDELADFYNRLADQTANFANGKGNNRSFLVRPSLVDQSATGHLDYDCPDLPIKGLGELEKALKHCYAELFRAENLEAKNLADLYEGRFMVSLLVWPLIEAVYSGRLIFDEKILVEAIVGRPEPLSEGTLSADRYAIDPSTLEITDRDINRQPWQITDLSTKAKHRPISQADQTRQKIDDETISQLAKLGLTVRSLTDFPIELTWLKDPSDQIWINDLKLMGAVTEPEPTFNLPTITPVLRGRPGVPGKATGRLRLIHNLDDVAELQTGEIAVVESLDLLNDELVNKVAGLIAETGLAHHQSLALASEAGLPTVRAAKGAHHQLAEGQLITIDGRTGLIYKGKPAHGGLPVKDSKTGDDPITAIKLWQRPTGSDPHGGDPSHGDGLGLLSAARILADEGIHPREILNQGNRRALEQKLVDELCQVAAAWQPRPIIYAANDWLGDDYRQLQGGAAHEPAERNPLLGYRGAGRALNEPDLFKIELEALRKVREDYGYNNLHLMLPAARTIKEFTATVALVAGAGLRPGRHFRLWLLAQTPAGLLMIKRLAPKKIIHGVCLDLDHLSQLILGVDHQNDRLSGYDLCDEGVLETLTKAVSEACHSGLPVLAAGSALERHPEALEALIEAGVTGLVAEPADLPALSKLVASTEQRLLLNHALTHITE